MKSVLKKGIAVLLAILCAFNFAVMSFAEESDSSDDIYPDLRPSGPGYIDIPQNPINIGIIIGACGESATWTIDKYTGILTISGTGTIEDSNADWFNCEVSVRTVIINDGITAVGKSAFNGFTALEEVYMAESVVEIGNNAFAGCSKLAIVTTLADDLSFENAFAGNDPRLFFVAKSGSETYNTLKSEGYTVNGMSTDNVKDGHKVLAFDGETTVYSDLDYKYISNIVADNPDAHYLYFGEIVFEGISPDTIIIDEENIDTAEKYFTLNDVYICVTVDGETITLPELIKLLQSEGAEGIISFEQKDEPTVFEPISDSFEDTVNVFIAQANRVIISVINALRRLFKR